MRNAVRRQMCEEGQWFSEQTASWLVNQTALNVPPPEIGPYDQGLLAIGFP